MTVPLQQFPFWHQDLTGFQGFCHLRLNLSLGNGFEQQILGKNLSGLVIPGIIVIPGRSGSLVTGPAKASLGHRTRPPSRPAGDVHEHGGLGKSWPGLVLCPELVAG